MHSVIEVGVEGRIVEKEFRDSKLRCVEELAFYRGAQDSLAYLIDTQTVLIVKDDSTVFLKVAPVSVAIFKFDIHRDVPHP
jgi:myo-inositol-hexaphosphate 3-phosphohydrolase